MPAMAVKTTTCDFFTEITSFIALDFQVVSTLCGETRISEHYYYIKKLSISKCYEILLIDTLTHLVHLNMNTRILTCLRRLDK